MTNKKFQFISNQKFHKGDFVEIAKNPMASKTNLASGRAVVVGSYSDIYGEKEDGDIMYVLYFKNLGESSWYKEKQLSLIEIGKFSLINKWKKEIEKNNNQRCDLKWIFSHGNEVIKNGYKQSVLTLAQCLGMEDLLKNSDEGFSWYQNAIEILALARPFLLSGDLKGWLNKSCKHL